MALERTTLRLAAVMLLANGFNAPFPTMAEGRVFDSRIDALDVSSGRELLPIIQVNTDDDEGTSLSANNGGPPFEHRVTLSIDVSIAVAKEGAQEVWFAATEAGLELQLDVFEQQILRLLRQRPGRWGRHFNAVARRLESYKSIRYVEPDGNTRIAARQLTLTVAVPVDNTLEALVVTTASQTPSVAAPLGTLLDDLIAHAPNFAADATRIRDNLLAGGLYTETVLPSLDTVRVFEDERDGQDRPTTARTQGIANIELPT